MLCRAPQSSLFASERLDIDHKLVGAGAKLTLVLRMSRYFMLDGLSKSPNPAQHVCCDISIDSKRASLGALLSIMPGLK